MSSSWRLVSTWRSNLPAPSELVSWTRSLSASRRRADSRSMLRSNSKQAVGIEQQRRVWLEFDFARRKRCIQLDAHRNAATLDITGDAAERKQLPVADAPRRSNGKVERSMSRIPWIAVIKGCSSLSISAVLARRSVRAGD